MAIGSIALLVGMVAIAIACVCAIGLYVEHRLVKEQPDSPRLKKLTAAGLLWAACLTAGFVALMAVRGLASDTAVGQFLNTSFGLAVGYLVLGAALNFAGMLLWKYGYPIFHEGRGDA